MVFGLQLLSSWISFQEGINGRIGFYMADLLKISSGQDFAFAVYGTAAHIQIRVFCVCAVCIRAAQAEQNDILSHMRIGSQKIVCGGLQLLFHFLYFHRVFLFDVMEKEIGKYLPQDQVKEMVTELGLTYVPVFTMDRLCPGKRFRPQTG